MAFHPAGWLPRNREAGGVLSIANFSDTNVALKVAMRVHKAQRTTEMKFLPTLDDALTDDLGKPRGSIPDEVTKALTPFTQVEKKETEMGVPPGQRRSFRLSVEDAPGDYLVSFTVKRGETLLAGALAPFEVPAPLGVTLQGHLLFSKALDFVIDLQRLKDSLAPSSKLEVIVNGPSGAVVAGKSFTNLHGRERIHEVFRFEPEPGANYQVVAKLSNGTNTVAMNSAFITAPPKEAIPDWWTMKEGLQPLVPPPWTAVKVSSEQSAVNSQKPAVVTILGREYEFQSLALPSQITTRGCKILAGPMEIKTSEPWKKSDLKLVTKADDAAVYESAHVAGLPAAPGTAQAGNVNLKVRTQVEFDGFMYVDLDLTGSGAVDKLDLV
ncbi:MAG: hypothetical protein AAB092_07830, partial [Chloroflexota bacterium]